MRQLRNQGGGCCVTSLPQVGLGGGEVEVGQRIPGIKSTGPKCAGEEPRTGEVWCGY